MTMFNKSSGDAAHQAVMQQQHDAAVASAADQLVMRDYLLKERAKLGPPGRTGPVDLRSINTPGNGGDSDSDLSDFDDDDPELQRIHEARRAELEARAEEAHEKARASAQGGRHWGSYEEIAQQDFLEIVTKCTYVVIAFYHKDFERCKIVDHHLARICPHHLETRFLRIDAEKAPFFVQKLAIQMLPTIVCFRDGVAIDRIVGFAELGGVDDFKTAVLGKRLVRSGVIVDKDGRRAKSKLAKSKVLRV